MVETEIKENTLLITPSFHVTKKRWSPLNIIQYWNRLRKIEYLPVQNEPFEYGIKIKNIGSNIFEEGKIKNIRIGSLRDYKLGHTNDNEFNVSTLNPQEEKEISLGVLRTHLDCQVWLSFEFIPSQQDMRIKTYQANSDQIEPYQAFNSWGNSFFIRPQSEVEQTKTNQLILILTVLTFVQGVWGLREALNWIFQGIIRFLNSLLVLFNWLAQSLT